MSIHKEAVRIATAAEMLEYDASTIRRKLKRGDLEAIGAGRGLRVTTHSRRPLARPNDSCNDSCGGGCVTCAGTTKGRPKAS